MFKKKYGAGNWEKAGAPHFFILFFEPTYIIYIFKKLHIRAKSHFFPRKTELVVDYYQHQVRLKTHSRDFVGYGKHLQAMFSTIDNHQRWFR